MKLKQQLQEPARELPVMGEFDVVVVGGGIAGVAAALAASRAGAKVCLLEKVCALGGLATVGNVIIYLPLCDGTGRQVIGGIGEELLRLSVSDIRVEDHEARFTRIPACWNADGDPVARRQQRFRVNFNPGSYILALERWLRDAGVTLLYDTRLSAVRRDAGRITHLLLESKSGRQALACRTVVDATGDADACHLAGEKTESLASNVAAGWYYSLRNGKLHLRTITRKYSRTLQCTELASRGYRGDDAGQLTAQILESREMIRQDITRLRAEYPQEEIHPFAPPAIACMRATRRLVGALSLGEHHMHQWFEDTVALTGDWRRKGPVFAIALRMLRGTANRNLIAAGRCMSADTTIWDCTRAIPTCAVTGEAAGTAAALAASDPDGGIDTLEAAAVRELLRRRGGLIEETLAARAPE